jgi:hypothetical protein
MLGAEVAGQMASGAAGGVEGDRGGRVGHNDRVGPHDQVGLGSRDPGGSLFPGTHQSAAGCPDHLGTPGLRGSRRGHSRSRLSHTRHS